MFEHMLGNKSQKKIQEYQELQNYDFVWEQLKNIPEYKQEGEKNQATFKAYLKQDYVNYSLGAMFGAFMGDALGSYLEFVNYQKYQVSQQAMHMPGGGVFNLISGQFTDDSELAAHMLQALSQFNNSQPISQQKQKITKLIADQYIQWYRSSPFDIGITTRTALNLLHEKTQKDESTNKRTIAQYNLRNQLQKIIKVNQNSQSNGSLMRNTPMAFFMSLLCVSKDRKTSEYIFQANTDFIRDEINMTHGNETIFKSSTAWIQLLSRLILRKENSFQKDPKIIYSQFIGKYQNDPQLKLWIEQAQNQNLMDAQKSMGWAKIAFSFGINHMRKLIQKEQHQMSQKDYFNILKDVLERKGDTDTNGAIVGGLIGAILGFDKLPKFYLKKQFQLSLYEPKDQNDKHRASFLYEPRRQFYTAMKMIQRFKQANIEAANVQKSQVKKEYFINQECNPRSNSHIKRTGANNTEQKQSQPPSQLFNVKQQQNELQSFPNHHLEQINQTQPPSKL